MPDSGTLRSKPYPASDMPLCMRAAIASIENGDEGDGDIAKLKEYHKAVELSKVEDNEVAA